MSEEEWRDIPGYEGKYQASSMGRVKSINRIVVRKFHYGDNHQPIKERILNPSINSLGYYEVHLGADNSGKKKTIRIHLLIAAAFLGKRPSGLHTCHNDGNSLNNNISNLRYDTRSSNERDKKITQTDNLGERNGRSKLKENQVRWVKTNKGIIPKRQMANMLNVKIGCIDAILYGINWKHVPWS